MMDNDQLISELTEYENKLSGIESRFSRRRDSINIAEGDDPRLRQYVQELVDLFNDSLGRNSYSAQIINAFNEGVSNFFGSPSLHSVQTILTTVRAAITRLRRRDTASKSNEAVSATADSRAGTATGNSESIAAMVVGPAAAKVFWSWQNDFAPKTCRHFIRAALKDAVEKVRSELNVDDAERPELDHDTKGKSGMVDIVDTILTKISESAVFVADLTPVAKTSDGKQLPNPNVLVELGWAFRRPGAGRIIGVLNTSSGCRPEDLPFDIRQRRILTYDLGSDVKGKPRKAIQAGLVRDLVDALKSNLSAWISQADEERQIQGVLHSRDRSIWASATDTLVNGDPDGYAGPSKTTFEHGSRGYIRVIPGRLGRRRAATSQRYYGSEWQRGCRVARMGECRFWTY